MKRLESPGADISTPETALGRCAKCVFRRWYLKHGDYPKALDDFIFEAHIRDGKQAPTMAKKACELSLWDEWMPVASLAAAHAELGGPSADVTPA
jgi:hypothetical protein